MAGPPVARVVIVAIVMGALAGTVALFAISKALEAPSEPRWRDDPRGPEDDTWWTERTGGR